VVVKQFVMKFKAGKADWRHRRDLVKMQTSAQQRTRRGCSTERSFPALTLVKSYSTPSFSSFDFNLDWVRFRRFSLFLTFGNKGLGQLLFATQKPQKGSDATGVETVRQFLFVFVLNQW